MLCSTTKSVGKQRVPHARRALPLLLTGALLQLLPAASQSQDCPVTPSTVPLSCLSGYTVSGGPSAVCDCQCGVNASAATDNAGGGQKLILQVASGAACSPTACRSCFTPCSAAAFVNATYASMAALQLDGQLSSVSYGTGAICITQGFDFTTSSASAGLCQPYLSGMTVAAYTGINATTAAAGGQSVTQQCSTQVAMSSSIAGGFVVACNTSNCNVAPAPAVAVSSAAAACRTGALARGIGAAAAAALALALAT